MKLWAGKYLHLEKKLCPAIWNRDASVYETYIWYGFFIKRIVKLCLLDIIYLDLLSR